MNSRKNPNRFSLTSAAAISLLIVACTMSCRAQAPAPTMPVETAAGQTGLASLRYNGIDLLADGGLSAQTIVLQNADGATVQGSTTPVSTAYDPAKSTLLQTYPWGTISCRYAPMGSRLLMAVSVTNSSPQTLSALTLQLMAIRFPAMPADWYPNGVFIASNTGDPSIVTADYGSGELAVCNEDVAGKPLLMGFPGRADFASRPIIVSTNPGWVLSPYLDKYIARPIASGATDTYHISVRFAPSGSTQKQIAGDILTEFAKDFPQTLVWNDHRSIGTLHLSEMESQAHSATNQEGWFGDATVDVVSDAGKKQFHDRLMKYAVDSMTQLKLNHSQGMIVWDIEGQHFPQPTSYIGDPRMLSTLSPVMDSDADEFFKAFITAGYRTGICIRPQQLTKQADGNYAQVELTTDDQVVSVLVDKIKYANKRWGCTLFYCDSNGDPNVPYPVTIYEQTTKQLAALGIKVLIMPEHKNTRYYAYTAPYGELDRKVSRTPARIKDVYPNAFTCIYIPDGDVAANHADLVTGVKLGDLLMYRGWWPDPASADINTIYGSAGK